MQLESDRNQFLGQKIDDPANQASFGRKSSKNALHEDTQIDEINQKEKEIMQLKILKEEALMKARSFEQQVHEVRSQLTAFENQIASKKNLSLNFRVN